jgi:hypothetical protein
MPDDLAADGWGPADYFLGLDLGPATEPTALAVLERRQLPDPGRPLRLVNHYAVRLLRRWAPRTPYEAVFAELKALLARPPFERPPLAVGQGLVGRAVVDRLRAAGVAASLRPAVVTNGQAAGDGRDGAAHVPKVELVGTLQVLLQGRRLQIADLPERPLLAEELQAFQMRPPPPGASYESFRERPHDDLVLAVALAAWTGERYVPWEPPSSLSVPRQSIWERLRSGPSRAKERGLYGRGRR